MITRWLTWPTCTPALSTTTGGPPTVSYHKFNMGIRDGVHIMVKRRPAQLWFIWWSWAPSSSPSSSWPPSSSPSSSWWSSRWRRPSPPPSLSEAAQPRPLHRVWSPCRGEHQHQHHHHHHHRHDHDQHHHQQHVDENCQTEYIENWQWRKLIENLHFTNKAPATFFLLLSVQGLPLAQ